MQTLRLGSKGPDVATWQGIIGVTADGDFGPKTEAATRAWQAARGLTADGVVGPKTWGAVNAPTILPAARAFPFVQAVNYTPASRTSVDLVVIHTMEAPEGLATAENVAAWFAGKNHTPARASAHYNVDANSIVQSVLEKDVAWHAGPVNGYSIGVEHAGYAKQTPEEWRDPYSLAVLERSAQLVGDICRRYAIPVRRLTGAELAAGQRRGICGHIDVTSGLTGGKGHWDPGPHFPWEWYLGRVLVHSLPFVHVEFEGVIYEVAPTYLAPVGIGEAERIAAAYGCELPSQGLVDAIWAAADLKLAPQPMSPNRGEDVAQFAAHAQAVEAAVGGRAFKLLAGSHKDVIRTANGSLALYGWHQTDGQAIQPPFGGHAPTWRDYSQGLRLVRRA